MENGKGYFVDEGMNSFDSFEKLLIFKFGSVENYIEAYKVREKWLEKEYRDREEWIKYHEEKEKNINAAFPKRKFRHPLTFSVLPNE